MSCPVLETERLLLRPHRVQDLSDCAAMWSDPLVVRHIGGKPFNVTETWSKILRYRGLWALLGMGYWAIEEKSSGRFLGELGFADFRRDMNPPLGDTPEVGWALCSFAHGKGFASEALEAILKWGDVNLTSKGTVCIIDPTNSRSIRLAEKFGYRQFQQTYFSGVPALIFKR